MSEPQPKRHRSMDSDDEEPELQTFEIDGYLVFSSEDEEDEQLEPAREFLFGGDYDQGDEGEDMIYEDEVKIYDDPELIKAVKKKNVNLVRTLLYNGANPNYVNEQGEIALGVILDELRGGEFDLEEHQEGHYEQRYVQIVRLLLNENAGFTNVSQIPEFVFLDPECFLDQGDEMFEISYMIKENLVQILSQIPKENLETFKVTDHAGHHRFECVNLNNLKTLLEMGGSADNILKNRNELWVYTYDTTNLIPVLELLFRYGASIPDFLPRFIYKGLFYAGREAEFQDDVTRLPERLQETFRVWSERNIYAENVAKQLIAYVTNDEMEKALEILTHERPAIGFLLQKYNEYGNNPLLWALLDNRNFYKLLPDMNQIYNLENDIEFSDAGIRKQMRRENPDINLIKAMLWISNYEVHDICEGYDVPRQLCQQLVLETQIQKKLTAPSQLAGELASKDVKTGGPNLPVEIWENILYRKMRDELCSAAPMTQFTFRIIQAMAEKLNIPVGQQDNVTSLCRNIAARLASFGEPEYQKQKVMNAQAAFNAFLWNAQRLGIDIRGMTFEEILFDVQELGLIDNE